MKTLIKEHLRIFSEGRLATHTPSNPRGANVGKDTDEATLNRVLARISSAVTNYKDNIYDYGGVYDGDGVYQVDLYPNGELVGRMTAGGAKREPGTFNDPNYNKRSFFVKACTNIQHSDQPERSCSPVGVSPMDDAVVKVLVFFKDDIIEFLRKNMEGEDDYTADEKGSEIQKQKMDSKWAYKLDREEKRKERAANKPGISIGDDKAEIVNQLQDIVREKVEARKNRDKDRVRALTRIEKQLREKL